MLELILFLILVHVLFGRPRRVYRRPMDPFGFPPRHGWYGSYHAPRSWYGGFGAPRAPRGGFGTGMPRGMGGGFGGMGGYSGGFGRSGGSRGSSTGRRF